MSINTYYCENGPDHKYSVAVRPNYVTGPLNNVPIYSPFTFPRATKRPFWNTPYYYYYIISYYNYIPIRNTNVTDPEMEEFFFKKKSLAPYSWLVRTSWFLSYFSLSFISLLDF